MFGNGVTFGFLDIASGGLTQATVLPDLSLTTGNLSDWFKFTITRDGQTGQFASVTFDQNQSHLQIALYSSGDTTVPIEEGVADGDVSQADGDVNRIDLQGLAAGTYYIEVTGSNPIADYDLEVDATIAPPTLTPTLDWAQPNSQSAPYDLRSVSGSQSFTGLAINTPNLPDWFEFATTAPGEDGDDVEIDFDNNAGDLDLALYNSNSPSAAPIKISETTNNREQVPLSNLPAGEYYIKVYGYEGATNDAYVLTINAPQTKVLPDALQPNNIPTLATNLDDASNIRNLDNLAVTLGSQEWFRFTLPNTGTATNPSIGTSADLVSIDFDNLDSGGALQLRLFGANQTLLQTSDTATGEQVVSLAGLKSGVTYYVEVLGAPSGRFEYVRPARRRRGTHRDAELDPHVDQCLDHHGLHDGRQPRALRQAKPHPDAERGRPVAGERQDRRAARSE